LNNEETMKLPVLYIIMRNDMASMNPGKAMAQASHASNAFVKCMSGVNNDTMFKQWTQSTYQGFGTVLVLAANISQILEINKAATATGYVNEIIYDPTYPIVDGQVVHHIPLPTCSYVFVPDKNEAGPHKMFLSAYSLHP
jgi:peptidyl-tRNA hydrolase